MKLSLLPTTSKYAFIDKADVVLLEFTENGFWKINIALLDPEKRQVFKGIVGDVISGTFYGELSECNLALKVVSVDGLEVSFTTTTDPTTVKITKKSFEKQ